MTLWCHEPCVFVLARGVDNQRRTMVPEPSSASPRVIAIFRVDPPTAKPISGSSATSILEDELFRAVISFQAAAAASIQNQRTSPQLIKHERPSCCSHSHAHFALAKTACQRPAQRLVGALLGLLLWPRAMGPPSGVGRAGHDLCHLPPPWAAQTSRHAQHRQRGRLQRRRGVCEGSRLRSATHRPRVPRQCGLDRALRLR